MARFLGRCWLALFGWEAVGELPTDTRKVVFIAAPHTSNWDLPFMLAIAAVLGLRLHWMGKHTLFGPPFGPLMRWLGGVPVDRSAPQGLVGQMADEFARRESFALAIPPEGTRSRAPHWKSGFYRIARAAKVPIACGFLDFANKRGGIGPVFVPGDDREADVARLANFYSPITGKHKDRFGPVQFKD